MMTKEISVCAKHYIFFFVDKKHYIFYLQLHNTNFK